MKEIIRYSERIKSTTLLGPGDRAVLWVFGCCFDCPGCIAYNFKKGPYIEETTESIAEWVLRTGKNDITISGGEPMLQAEALAMMLEKIRKVRDIGVIVYTGYVYEDLLEEAKQNDGIKCFLNAIDVLIDGPYLEGENNNDPYRGSSNQRILQLTGRYADLIEEYYFSEQGRKIEVRLNDDKTLMIGVPSKDQADIWKNIKKLGIQNEINE